MATIRLRRVDGAPVVAIRIWLPGGTAAEETAGLAWVSGRLLVEGTGARDWRRITDQAEDRGISLGADAGYEAQGLALDALAGDWELALEWAAELLCDSTFPEDRCRWMVRQTAAELEQLADHPEVRTSWAFASQLYGDTERGRPLQGNIAGLERIGSAACRGFHEACLARGAIVSIAGDFDRDQVFAKARTLFADLATPDPDDFVSAVVARKSEARRVVELPASGQAQWFAGAITVSRRDPDYWPLVVLGVVLGAGGGLTGRITHRVRELEGLAYSCSVASVSGAGRGAGCFTVAAGVTRDRVDELGEAVEGELRRLVRDGVTTAELAEARAYLLGRDPFVRETARQWATLMAQAELFGLPLEDAEWVARKWRSVGDDELRRAAQRYLDPARLRVTVGRPS